MTSRSGGGDGREFDLRVRHVQRVAVPIADRIHVQPGRDLTFDVRRMRRNSVPIPMLHCSSTRRQRRPEVGTSLWPDLSSTTTLEVSLDVTDLTEVQPEYSERVQPRSGRLSFPTPVCAVQ